MRIGFYNAYSWHWLPLIQQNILYWGWWCWQLEW